MESIQASRGTHDILPEDVGYWQQVEAIARQCLQAAAYQEIRTPTFEQTHLFERGIGEATDIVGKEMYTFQDRGDRSITLRPEGTAGVVRAFIEHKLHAQGWNPASVVHRSNVSLRTAWRRTPATVSPTWG